MLQPILRLLGVSVVPIRDHMKLLFCLSSTWINFNFLYGSFRRAVRKAVLHEASMHKTRLIPRPRIPSEKDGKRSALTTVTDIDKACSTVSLIPILTSGIPPLRF